MFKSMTITKKKIGVPSVRDIAHLTGVSAATVNRFQNGGDVKLSIAKKLEPHMTSCPCCGGVKVDKERKDGA